MVGTTHFDGHEKMVRMQAASHLLQQFEDEGDAFLKSIVTTNETWCTTSFPSPSSHHASGGISVLPNSRARGGAVQQEK